MIRRLTAAFLVSVALLSLPPLALARPTDDPKTRIDTVLSAPLFKNAIVGVLVKSLDDGRVLYEKNADVALMPASNLKLLTAATAARKLGRDFHFTTTLLYTGTIDKRGELKGDLYLKGDGDPSLNARDVLSLANQLKTAGVKKFNGRIIADASVFDNQLLGEGWEWDDEPFYYQAQVSGLNCDENVVPVVVNAGVKIGDTAVVTMRAAEDDAAHIPPTRYLGVRNTVQTVAGGSTASVTFDRSRARNEAVVTGTVPLGGKPAAEAVTMEDPALFTASRLWDCLGVVGITVPKPEKQRYETGVVPSDAHLVGTHDSKPLIGLLADFLKPSDNLYGECLLKTLGRQKGGVGSWSAGIKVVREFFTEAGMDASGLSMADGSGLSRKNNVTPRLLVSLLTTVDTTFPTELKEAFVNGLPVGGVDGTLRGRFKGTAAQSNVHAKTGSLSGVSSLSGYVTTATGERLVFSILMNHFTSGGTTAQARAAQDAIVLALLETPRATP